MRSAPAELAKPVRHWRAALAIASVAYLVSALTAPAPAAALSAPDVFLKERSIDKPVGDWLPLDGAKMHSVTGYEIGVRLQDTAEPQNGQRILVRVTSVPDGHPNQHYVYSLCFSQTGTAGKIVPIDERVTYEGEGTYTLAVTGSIGPDASTDCETGATTTGSFTAHARTRAKFDGKLEILDPRGHPPFSGLVVRPSEGFGGIDWMCARNPHVASSGALTGSDVSHGRTIGAAMQTVRVQSDSLFPSPGRWACVARSVGGVSEPQKGPWSKPTPTSAVKRGFYGAAPGAMRLRDAKGPRYKVTEKLNKFTRGGTARLSIKRYGTSKRVKLHHRVGRDGVVAFRFRLPGVRAGDADFYIASLAFDGNRLVASRQFKPEFALSLENQGSGTEATFPSPCAPRRC